MKKPAQVVLDAKVALWRLRVDAPLRNAQLAGLMSWSPERTHRALRYLRSGALARSREIGGSRGQDKYAWEPTPLGYRCDPRPTRKEPAT